MKKKIYAGLVLVILFLNILSWRSTDFCDWFRREIFHWIVESYARFSGLFPFSVGENMIIAGVIFVLAALLCLLALLFILLFGKIAAMRRKQETVQPAAGQGKDSAGRRFMMRYLHFFAWLLLIVSLVMTLNCFILYHCTSFRGLYMQTPQEETYSLKQLVLVRDYVISQANSMSSKMQRDEDGNLIYDGNMKEQAVHEMQELGKDYPLLTGYYPHPKQIRASKFLSQQYMMGYYFPFSMEANYNGEMYISNVPVTMCHELSHLHGFIYEDDANFIGYLACVNSEDSFFRYSGYLSVISYLNNDLYKSLDGNRRLYLTYRQCNAQVKHDNVFLTKDAWKIVEKKAVVKTATLKKASNAFLTTNLNMNGVDDGIASYGNVVKYLLEYYNGTLY